MEIPPTVVLKKIVAETEIQIQLRINLSLSCNGIGKKLRSPVLRRDRARSMGTVSIHSNPLSVGLRSSILISSGSGSRFVVVTLYMPLVVRIFIARLVHQTHHRFNSSAFICKCSGKANAACQMDDINEIGNASWCQHLWFKTSAIRPKKLEEHVQQKNDKRQPNHSFKNHRSCIAGTVSSASIHLSDACVVCSQISINMSSGATAEDGHHRFIDQCVNWNFFAP